MQYLCPPLFSVGIKSTCNPYSAATSTMAVGVMTMLEGQQYLHEIIPDSIFWNRPIVLCSLLDDRREVAASAVFHHDVEDSGIPIDVTVMVAYNVVVVEVFQYISAAPVNHHTASKGSLYSHFSDNLFSISLAHSLKVELLSGEYLDRRSTPSLRVACC